MPAIVWHVLTPIVIGDANGLRNEDEVFDLLI